MANRPSLDQIPVVLLCGGNGISVNAGAMPKELPGVHCPPKALIRVNGKPLVEHIIKGYAKAGFKNFYLSIGKHFNAFKDIPFEADLRDAGFNVRVNLCDTGETTTTGGRIARLKSYMGDAPYFCATYSDTVSDVDLARVFSFHLEHGRLATLVSAALPVRFRILGFQQGDPQVRYFSRKPVIQNDRTNGGFYIFSRAILDVPYLGLTPDAVLETTILDRLVAEGELFAFNHDGQWNHLDSDRDLDLITNALRNA